MNKIQRTYKKGTRVEVVKLFENYGGIVSGDRGTIESADDIGRLYTKWDNGSGFSILLDIDEFKIIKQATVVNNKPQAHQDQIDISSLVGKTVDVESTWKNNDSLDEGEIHVKSPDGKGLIVLNPNEYEFI